MINSRIQGELSAEALVKLADAILDEDGLTERRDNGPILVARGRATPSDEVVGAVEPMFVDLEPYRILANQEQIATRPEATQLRTQLARLVRDDLRWVEGEFELDETLGHKELSRLKQLVEPPVIVLSALASEAGILRERPVATAAVKGRYSLLVVGAPVGHYLIDLRLGVSGGGTSARLELAGSVYRRGHTRPTARRVRITDATYD